MSHCSRHLRAYRALVLLYPRSFRREFGALLYRRSRIPYTEAVRLASSRWWGFLLGGLALFAAIASGVNLGPDMAWFPWHLLVFLFLSAWTLVIAGILLGLVHLIRRFRRPAVPSL